MGRPRMQPPDVVRPVSIGLSPEMLDRLDLAARSERVSRSCLVRELIGDGLDRLAVGGAASASSVPPAADSDPVPVDHSEPSAHIW